jgi:hypothetical protein
MHTYQVHSKGTISLVTLSACVAGIKYCRRYLANLQHGAADCCLCTALDLLGPLSMSVQLLQSIRRAGGSVEPLAVFRTNYG